MFDDLLVYYSLRTHVYIELDSSWYELRTHKKMLSMNVMSKINESVGPAGLVGLDKLYSHMIKSELDSVIQTLEASVMSEKMPLDLLNAWNEDPLAATQPLKFYNNLITKLAKNAPKVFDSIISIGQKQVLRKYISHELNGSCKFNSKNLESSLQTMNKYEPHLHIFRYD